MKHGHFFAILVGKTGDSMKKMIFFITILMAFTASAELKKFNLHYTLGDQHLEVPMMKDSYESAIEAGADSCFRFFTGHGKLTHEQKLDVVDVCANPRGGH
jgi:hypothetical protein